MAGDAQLAKTQQTQIQIPDHNYNHTSSNNNNHNNENPKPRQRHRQKSKRKHTIQLPHNGIIALHATNLLSRVASPPLGMNDAVVTFTDTHTTYVMHISDYRRVELGFAHLEIVLQQHYDPLDYSTRTNGGIAVTAFTNRETLKERVAEQIRKRRRGSLFSGCVPVHWSPLADADGEADGNADPDAETETDAGADTDTDPDACEGPWLEIDSDGEEVNCHSRGWQKRVQVQYVQQVSGNVLDAGVVEA